MKTELKGIIFLLICLAVISSISACTNASESAASLSLKSLDLSQWELVWQDDFAKEKLDDAKWTRCKQGKPDWKNTMSDDPRLLKIEDGVLHLRGIVNGKPTLTYPRVPALGEKQWPFNQPFYFILSMQIGGNWVNGSGPTNPAHYPAGMEVDWVRVYSPVGCARHTILSVLEKRVGTRCTPTQLITIRSIPPCRKFPADRF